MTSKSKEYSDLVVFAQFFECGFGNDRIVLLRLLNKLLELEIDHWNQLSNHQALVTLFDWSLIGGIECLKRQLDHLPQFIEAYSSHATNGDYRIHDVVVSPTDY